MFGEQAGGMGLLGGCPRTPKLRVQVPFCPNSSDLSKKYPRNINYMPVVFLREIFDFEQVSEARDSEMPILGQAPKHC